MGGTPVTGLREIRVEDYSFAIGVRVRDVARLMAKVEELHELVSYLNASVQRDIPVHKHNGEPINSAYNTVVCTDPTMEWLMDHMTDVIWGWESDLQELNQFLVVRDMKASLLLEKGRDVVNPLDRRIRRRKLHSESTGK